MRNTSSYPEYNSGRSGKGLINSLSLKSTARPKSYKKLRYSILNVSMKYLSKINRKFEKLPYKRYDKRRPKHEHTDSYFYLARQLEKCMVRADTLNSYVYPVRTKTTATGQIPTLHVCSTDKSKL